MADPSKGSIFDSTSIDTLTESVSQEERRLSNIYQMNVEDDNVRQMRQNMFVNTCVLLAIKEFMYDYFYSNFQFALIKTACSYTHYLVTQNLTDEWNIPKLFRGEFKRPAPKKPKKTKLEKKKQDKKEKKKDKGSKKDKKSSKSKKSKDSKGKKKESKEGNKPGGLTKEEKAEMLRLQREQARLEEEQRIAATNRQFLFPLTDAATDEFFEGVFENWVKPKKKEKRTKGKDKGSQKSSKSSKKGKN
ncbi:unnamed protein product [Acanthoscelides obtectus]|nr:unnamed protein product [Acanthoscelides obtectus]CAK1620045.1 hypothetical protein AOBTE_LOCUS157 [Acanthoscelides obtectus]